VSVHRVLFHSDFSNKRCPLCQSEPQDSGRKAEGTKDRKAAGYPRLCVGCLYTDTPDFPRNKGLKWSSSSWRHTQPCQGCGDHCTETLRVRRNLTDEDLRVFIRGEILGADPMLDYDWGPWRRPEDPYLASPGERQAKLKRQQAEGAFKKPPPKRTRRGVLAAQVPVSITDPRPGPSAPAADGAENLEAEDSVSYTEAGIEVVTIRAPPSSAWRRWWWWRATPRRSRWTWGRAATSSRSSLR